MATVKVIAGDLRKGQQKIDLRRVKEAELQTEEKLKKLAGSAGWGFAGAVVGGLLTGGIGLAVGGLAGILSGGNKTEICFSCELDDGRKFLAVTDKKTWQKILADLFEKKQTVPTQSRINSNPGCERQSAEEPDEKKENLTQVNPEMNQQDWLRIAKQGNPKAIAALLNRSLKPKGVLAKTALTEGCLQIVLEAKSIPPQQALVAYIENAMRKLGATSIQEVKIYGKQIDNNSPAWQQRIELQPTGTDSNQNVTDVNPPLEKAESHNELREAAKKGDLPAISKLVQQAFSPREVSVEAGMHFGITLWLKLRSNKDLEPQSSLNTVAKLLDEIKPEKINSIRLSQAEVGNSKEQIWNKYLTLKQESFVDNTKTVNRITYAVWGVIALGIVSAVSMYKPDSITAPPPTTSTSNTPSSSSPNESRVFLGRSKTGYELWADKSCVYVKGITEADLARLNTDVWGYKDAVKAETGYKCVIFE